MKFFLDCKNAVHICDKAQYKDAGTIEYLRFKMHLWFCSCCKKHSVKNTKLTKVINRADLKCMPKEDKQELAELVEKELNQH